MINVNEVQEIIQYLRLFQDSKKYKSFSTGEYNVYKSKFSKGLVYVEYTSEETPYGSLLVRLSNPTPVNDDSFTITTGIQYFTYHRNGDYTIYDYPTDISNKRILHRSSAFDLEDDKFQYRTIYNPDIIDFLNLSIEGCNLLMFYHLMSKQSTELLELLNNEFLD